MNEELKSSDLFEVMNINTDEDEHSIEMQLPYIAKVMEGLVLCGMVRLRWCQGQFPLRKISIG